MIPLLILLYARKNKQLLISNCLSFLSHIRGSLKLLLLMAACMGAVKKAFAQTRHYQYEIQKGGSRIGEISILYSVAGPICSLQLVSDIRYRFLFLLTARSREEVVFTNGVMTFSSIYREQNGDVTIRTKTRKAPYSYIVEGDDVRNELRIPDVYYHTISLYVTEPVGQKKVYTDKFRQLVAIEQVEAHHYKVEFPDGNYNEYFYRDGICRSIKVNQTLFSAQIELKKIF